jgi:hypothetical protein
LSQDGENAFKAALRETIALFKLEEEVIRADYKRKVEKGSEPGGIDDVDLLERPTRRFLIDAILRALDWSPDDPGQIAEESRSRSLAGKALFFDYLGMARTRAPAMLVEAKGFDAELTRRPGEDDLTSREMSRQISREIATLKSETGKAVLLALWSGWLSDLRDYVRSFEPSDQDTLRRVVITAGRWMIVFADPVGAFVDPGVPDPDDIHCFRSLDEIEQNAALIFRLLNRQRLVDTLPLTLTPGEALEVLQPSAITAFYRGVVVATQMVGAARGPYPSRSIHPAVVLTAGGRSFAVTDYLGQPVEEPRNPADLPAFLAALQTKGEVFEHDVLAQLGRQDLTPTAVDQFPAVASEPATARRDQPQPNSTAALVQANTPQRPQLVRPTGELGTAAEYLVVTGETWFYKRAAPFGLECDFHAWPKAKKKGVAAAEPHMGGVANSFTASDDPQHCEHDGLRHMRNARCHLKDIETHLCCRVCIFHAVCWPSEDVHRLPCAI